MASPIVRPRRPAPVFVCRKCLKRSDDARTIKKALKRALKEKMRRAAGADEKSARLIGTSCFGLCPKRAVIVTAGVRAARGEYVLVSSPQDVAAALELLQTGQNEGS